MIDLANYVQSDLAWVALFVTALFVGMSKTGVQGITLLTIPLLAMAFEAKPSTGIMLPLLCFADVIGVSYYHRQAKWRHITRLLPSTLAGFALALLVDSVIPVSEFKHLLGACLALVLVVMLWTQWKGKENVLADSWWYGPLFGLLGGFTTMIGNAAGPILAIYLLSVRMPKLAFVGTNAWFFLCVNFLKLPLQAFVWHNITLSTLALDVCAIPFILLGAYLGVKLVKFLPERGFRVFTTTVTIISVLVMLFV